MTSASVMRVLTSVFASFSRLGCRLVRTKTQTVRPSAASSRTASRFKMNRAIYSCSHSEHEGPPSGVTPRHDGAAASALDPDLVEMLFQGLVLVAAVHALAMGAIDRTPVGL